MPTNSTLTPTIDPRAADRTTSLMLPVNHDLRLAYLFSLLIAALTAVAALAGALSPKMVYPTAVSESSFRVNDLATLLIGLPVLLLALGLARRGHLLGLLLWPGALLYGLYNYIVYLFGAPLTALYPLFLLIVTLSLYTLIGLLAAIDAVAVKTQLHGRVPSRLGGGVLMGLGLLFALRALAVISGAVSAGTTLTGPELGLAVADFLLAAAWMAGGWLLWRERPLGYAGGTALLCAGSMLFAGLIAILALQAPLQGTPPPLLDIGVVLLMGLFVFIPCGQFIRGIYQATA